MGAILEKPGIVVSNTSLTNKLWLMKVKVEGIGKKLLPGQFVHILIPGMEGHILRRPFSVYYTEEDGDVLVILYQVVGFGSKHMTSLKEGAAVSVMGPIGNGWTIPEAATSALLVAGGVGGAPLYLFAESLITSGVNIDVILGAQTAQALVVEDKYKALSLNDLYIATDDGTKGHAGFCTDLVAQCISNKQYDFVACCGPEPMMKIVSQQSLNAHIPTFISLEKRMACGIGACLSCIVETTNGKKRSCVDGPIFDAAEVIW